MYNSSYSAQTEKISHFLLLYIYICIGIHFMYNTDTITNGKSLLFLYGYGNYNGQDQNTYSFLKQAIYKAKKVLTLLRGEETF